MELGRDLDMPRNVPMGAMLAPQPTAREENLVRWRTASQKKSAYFTYIIYLRRGAALAILRLVGMFLRQAPKKSISRCQKAQICGAT